MQLKASEGRKNVSPDLDGASPENAVPEPSIGSQKKQKAGVSANLLREPKLNGLAARACNVQSTIAFSVEDQALTQMGFNPGIVDYICKRLPHMFSRPTNERYHPAGLIFSTLGAILVLFICYKLKIHLPQVNPF